MTNATTEDRTMAGLAVAGLAVGAVFGLVGDQLPLGAAHVLLLLVSSLGLVAGTALLAHWHLRQRRVLIGTGFAVLAVAEMLIWATGGPVVGDQASFAAGVAFYVPALLLISVPGGLPGWARGAGMLAAVPFGVLATIALTGGEPPAVLQDAGYGLLTIALVGWAHDLLGETRSPAPAARPAEPKPAR